MSLYNSKKLRKKANNRRKKYPFFRALLTKVLFPWKPVVIYTPGDFQNPYQSLLYSKFKAHVSPVTIDKVLRYHRFRVADVLHIHWDEAVIPKADEKKSSHVKQVIKSYHNAGGKIIWTVHNKMPHELQSDQQKALFLSNRAFMCDYADKIHVHNNVARDYLIDNFNVDINKVIVLAHPSYREWYCIEKTLLQFNEKKSFLLFGNMRSYKGFDLVVKAFAKIHSVDLVSELHIAGNGADQVNKNKFPSKMPITISSGYISDEDVQKLYQTSDFAIFGFKSILTSGSVILAVTFGVPPIAPAHPGVIDSLPGELHDLLYKPNDADDFARVIDYALSLDADKYAHKVSVCHLFAEKIKPSNISNQLEKEMFK